MGTCATLAPAAWGYNRRWWCWHWRRSLALHGSMINTDRHVILCVVISSISIAAAPMIIHTFYVITATALHVHVVCRRSTCLVLVGLMFVSTVTSRCASSPPSRHGVPCSYEYTAAALIQTRCAMCYTDWAHFETLFKFVACLLLQPFCQYLFQLAINGDTQWPYVALVCSDVSLTAQLSRRDQTSVL